MVLYIIIQLYVLKGVCFGGSTICDPPMMLSIGSLPKSDTVAADVNVAHYCRCTFKCKVIAI